MHLKSETYLKLVIIMASNRLNIHVALFFHVTNMYVKPGRPIELRLISLPAIQTSVKKSRSQTRWSSGWIKLNLSPLIQTPAKKSARIREAGDKLSRIFGDILTEEII